MRNLIRSFMIIGGLTTAVLLSVGTFSVAKDESLVDLKLPRVPAVLSVVPDTTLAVQVVDNPARFSSRVSTIADRFGNPGFDPLAMIMPMFEGIDEKGSVAVAWFMEEGKPAPVSVFFLPVTNFEAFRERLGGEAKGDGVWIVQVAIRTFLATQKDGYAILVPAENEKVLKNVMASQKSLFDEVSARSFWKANQDLGAIVTPQGIKTFSAMAVGSLDQMKLLLAAGNDPQAKAAAGAMEMYKQMFARMENEVSYLAVGAQLDDKGSMRLNARVQFAKDGSLAKIGETEVPERHLLTGLPHEDFVFASGATFSKTFIEWMLDASVKMMKSMPELYGDLTDEQVKQMQDSWKKMADWDSMAMRFAAPEAGELLLSGVSGVMRVGDASKFLDAYVVAMEQFTEIIGDADNPAVPKMNVEKVQIGALAAVKVVTKMNVPPGPAGQMIEKFYGPNGEITAYLAAADDKTVVLGYASEDALKRAVESAVKPGLSADRQIRKTSGMLMDEPHMVGYASARGMIQLASYFMTLVPGGIAGVDLPPFPDVPPIGTAVKLRGSHLEAETVVPDEFLSALAEYIELVKQQQAERF
ncbi:MAG TPA: hypothetical protein VMX74_02480 [Pirellulales bacterium]|nr:hypothetical protein [Pirellulales bacterium]